MGHNVNSSGSQQEKKDGKAINNAEAVELTIVSFVGLVDFISEPGWEQPLAQLAQRHEVVAVRLHDPLERQLPDLGLLLMQDAESGEQLYVDTGDARLRARFAAAAARRDEALGAAFAQAGVDALELSTAEPLLDTVLRFADARKRRGRSSGSAPLRRPETLS